MKRDRFKIGIFLAVVTMNLQVLAQPFIEKVISPGDGSHEGNGIVQDADGFIYLTGQHQTAAFVDGVTLATLLGEDIVTYGRTDFYLAKFTSNLEPVWVKTAGSKQFDFGTVVRIAPNGDILVCGAYQGTLDFEGHELANTSGWSDSFIARFDPSGSLLWVQTINGSQEVIADGMTLDSKGNIYLTGRLRHVAMFGNEEVGARFQSRSFLTKLDRNGTFVFSKIVTQTGQSGAVVVDYAHDDNLYIGGSYAGNPSGVFVASYTTSGSENFIHTYAGGSPDEISDIQLGTDNHIYITGRFSSDSLDLHGVTLQNPADFFAGFVAKLTLSGESVWGHIIGDRGTQFVIDASNTLFVTGYYTEKVTSIAGQQIEYVGGLDAFLTRLSSDGVVQWVTNYSSSANDLARTITMSGDGSLLLAGEASHEAFETEPLGGNVFIAKTEQIGTAPEVPSEEPALKVRWVEGELRLTLSEEFVGFPIEATTDLGVDFDLADPFLEAVPEMPNTFKISLESPTLFFRLIEP